MIRQTTIALTITAAAVLGGPALAAQASTGHHHHNSRSAPTDHLAAGSERGKHHHHATCGGKCTPAPKPPAGGWPCQTTHSCKPSKVPHCPPVKHHHPKPPVKPPTHVTPKPPIKVTPPPTQTVAHRPHPHTRTTAPSDVPVLAVTGGVPWPLIYTGGALVLGGIAATILAGAGGNSPRQQAKAMRAGIAATRTSRRSRKAA